MKITFLPYALLAESHLDHDINAAYQYIQEAYLKFYNEYGIGAWSETALKNLMIKVLIEREDYNEAIEFLDGIDKIYLNNVLEVLKIFLKAIEEEEIDNLKILKSQIEEIARKDEEEKSQIEMIREIIEEKIDNTGRKISSRKNRIFPSQKMIIKDILRNHLECKQLLGELVGKLSYERIFDY